MTKISLNFYKMKDGLRFWRYSLNVRYFLDWLFQIHFTEALYNAARVNLRIGQRISYVMHIIVRIYCSSNKN